MRIQIRVDPSGGLEKQILSALRLRLDSVFKRAAPAVRVGLANLCGRLVEGTPEYASLLGGGLLGELGIPDVERRVREVVRAVGASVVVRANPVRVVGSRLTGGMSAYLLKAGFEDLTGLPAASYVSAPSGSTVPWLDWLLLQGDKVLVYGYDVKFDLRSSERARSRTGLALMEVGSGWRVPPEFSGTEQSNFLTRAFDAAAAESMVARVFHDAISVRLDG